MLCPELIGRQGEVRRLRDRVMGLAAGHGGLVVLAGDAGAGKSRLLHEATTGEDLLFLSGRCVPGGSPVPYRPLAEALLGALRGRALPSDPTLHGFEGQLARLVPSWDAGAPADDSPVLLGEAIVRLLGVLSLDRPSVLILEDLHWADPETLDAVRYLSDGLAGEALCVCTCRPEGAAAALLHELDRRDPDSVVRVGSLDGAEVSRMIAACLGSEPPAGLREFVQAHSEGSPFLVEELLAGLIATGALREDDGRWEITGPLNPAVPASLRDSIGRRLDSLDPTARRVLGAAALLGRAFDWELLPGVAEVDGRAAVDALRAGVRDQLIETVGDGFRFRHALTREAVLADLLPPERHDLAERAWPAIERANPGLPGSSCLLAADLAEAAGDPLAASGRLLESARRALSDGALATAEATARRARALAAGDPVSALDADELLLHVLAAAGKSGEALTLGRGLAEQLATIEVGAMRQADLLVALARAAVTAGDLDTARAAARDARRIAERTGATGSGADPALLARIDAVAAEVALDRAELEEAERCCRRAIAAAEATHQPEVVCEALLVLGRVLRPQGTDRARASFRQAADVAEGAGLARWHLRAQQELALEGWASEGSRELLATRALAARYGAHLTVAAMDLAIADIALANFDAEGCTRASAACVTASRRYGLAAEPVAHLWSAGAHALAGEDDAMRTAIDAALARDPDDPRILGDLYGRVLATRAFVRDELDELPGLLDEMMVHVRRAPPTTSVYPGRVVWALVHTIDDDDHGAAARAMYHETTTPMVLQMFELMGQVIDAVALGRAGDTEGASARMRPAYEAAIATPVGMGMVRTTSLLVSRAAIRDGWGEPVRWLRESEAWFGERGFDRLARRARILLGEAGVPVPRRGRGDSEVPVSLRALGVTSREVDVLKLVMDGRSTKEIAAQLHLSPKTVERHLTSLFDRTGVRNRQALAEVGEAHLS